jgi:hypothetical protein
LRYAPGLVTYFGVVGDADINDSPAPSPQRSLKVVAHAGG